MAVIGDVLTSPETGWKRYDNLHPTIRYVGSGWGNESVSGNYNLTTTLTRGLDNPYYEFSFYGTKFRLITARNNDHSSQIEVSIDGQVVDTYSAYQPSLTRSVLAYEKLNLPLKVYKVKVRKLETVGTNIVLAQDGIDIDSTGTLYHADEVTDVSELEIGKRIRCHYRSTLANETGIFSNVGKEVYVNGNLSDFISTSSTTTPNGQFYFLMTGYDHQGNAKLIADRNIQNGISWDKINVSGFASSSGNEIYDSDVSILSISSNAVHSAPYAASNLLSADPINFYASGSTRPITISFQASKSIRKIGMMCAIYGLSFQSSGMPKSFDLYGSTNGTSYTLIQNYSNIPLPVDFQLIYVDVPQNNFLYYEMRNIISQANGDINLGYLHFVNDITNMKYGIRVPKGGISTSDLINEWDENIVNSTLNNTITAGSNSMWNWSGQYSWTSTTISGTMANRVIRGNTASNAHTSAATGTTTASSSGFRPVLIVELDNTKYYTYLIKENNVLKYWNGSSWTTAGNDPATEAMFKTSTMTNLNDVPSSAWALLSGSVELLYWTNDTAQTTKSYSISATPKSELLQSQSDLNICEFGLFSVQLNATITGNATIKMAISTDAGNTWKAFNGSSWNTVGLTKTAIQANGMTYTAFNQLTATQLASGLNGSQIIRFAYVITTSSGGDQAVLDSLTITPATDASPVIEPVTIGFKEETIAAKLTTLETEVTRQLLYLNLKAKTLLAGASYQLHHAHIDGFDTNTSFTGTTATYSSANKNFTNGILYYSATAESPITKLLFVATTSGTVSYEYSVDGGTTYTSGLANTLIELSNATESIRLKITIASGGTFTDLGICYA